MKGWAIVFRKEVFEVFRDRRTFFNIILSPLLITPLILALVGSMARRQARDARQEQVSVGIVGRDRAPAARELFDGAEKELRLRFVDVTRADAEARIRARDLKAAAVLPDDAQERLTDQQTVPVQILQDVSSDASRQAADRLHTFFEKRGERLTARRLMDAGLSQQLARPFEVGDVPLKGTGGAGLLLLTSFLPYVLAISAILGGVFVANDAVAGEKERGTLESLLVTPVSRRDIALGKYAATATMSLLSGTLSLVGLLWPFAVPLPFFAWMTEGGLRLSPAAIAAMFLVLLPLSILGAGVLLAISTIARNQKEAQTYLGPTLMAVSVLAMISMLQRADAPLPVALAPVLGTALVLKQALQGSVHLPFVVTACAASLVYAVAALVYATRLFQKESVLLKG